MRLQSGASGTGWTMHLRGLWIVEGGIGLVGVGCLCHRGLLVLGRHEVGAYPPGVSLMLVCARRGPRDDMGNASGERRWTALELLRHASIVHWRRALGCAVSHVLEGRMVLHAHCLWVRLGCTVLLTLIPTILLIFIVIPAASIGEILRALVFPSASTVGELRKDIVDVDGGVVMDFLLCGIVDDDGDFDVAQDG